MKGSESGGIGNGDTGKRGMGERLSVMEEVSGLECRPRHNLKK